MQDHAGQEQGPSEIPQDLSEVFGPSQVDHSLRQALQTCWMMLPEGRRNVEHAERVFRHLVDRAIKDMKEDAEIFGKP